MEKWVERPLADYLQYIEVWIQIQNNLVNHYTLAAITNLGEFAGQVIEVAFDPTKAHNIEFVRVRVKFDVSKLLRRPKLVKLPSGEVTTILYDYERLQKRYYCCQRFTHEEDKCHVFLRQNQAAGNKGLGHDQKKKLKGEVMLKELDPLYGILNEEQVSLNSLTRRPHIAEDIMEEIKQYLSVANGDERVIREARVKSSLAELEKDPLTPKTMMRLEPALLVSKDLDKRKGRVFDFAYKESQSKAEAQFQHSKN